MPIYFSGCGDFSDRKFTTRSEFIITLRFTIVAQLVQTPFSLIVLTDIFPLKEGFTA